MKTSKKKTFLATVTILMSTSLLLTRVYAWPSFLRPGSHVFDIKRFSDSVNNTAKVIEIYKKMAEMYAGRTLKQLGIQNKISKVINEMNHSNIKINEKINGKSIVDIKNKLSDNKVLNRNWAYEDTSKLFQKVAEYQEKILLEADTGNTEATAAVFKIAEREKQRDKLLTDINNLFPSGNLGEMQKRNSLKAIRIMQDIDSMRLQHASAMQNIIEKEQQTEMQRLEEHLNKAVSRKMYDPVNPDKFDKKHRTTKSENFGFLRYKE